MFDNTGPSTSGNGGRWDEGEGEPFKSNDGCTHGKGRRGGGEGPLHKWQWMNAWEGEVVGGGNGGQCTWGAENGEIRVGRRDYQEV